MDTPVFDDPDDQGHPPTWAAEELHVTVETLATWRSQGKGPKFRKLGRYVEYTPRHIKEFKDACVRTPEPAAARRQRSAIAAA
jgi:hypothetical protein